MSQVANNSAESLRRELHALCDRLLRAGLLTEGQRYPLANLAEILPGSDGEMLRARAEALALDGPVSISGERTLRVVGDEGSRVVWIAPREPGEAASSTAAGEATHADARAGEGAEQGASEFSNQATQVPRIKIIHGDNMSVLPGMEDGSFRLIYIDPPFNTRKKQSRLRLRTQRVASGGDRTGYHGARYKTTVLGKKGYDDSFDDYLGFLEPRLREAHRLLTDDGSLFLHLDYREVHYAKVLLDKIFGRDSFQNEIIWAYDYGARTKKRWSAKHDNILWYAKTPNRYVFNYDEMDRIPYMAPGLVGAKKAARGKTPTDVWWHTIVSPSGKERTGYPTQKPVGVLKRIVRVHSNPGDQLLDFFAGSGSFGEAGAMLERFVTLVDANPEAIEVMNQRLERYTAGATTTNATS